MPAVELVLYVLTNALLFAPALIVALAARAGGGAGLTAALLLAGTIGGLNALSSGGGPAVGLCYGAIGLCGIGGLGMGLWIYGNRPLSIGRLVAGLISMVFVGTVGLFVLFQWLGGSSLLDMGYGWLRIIDASYDHYLEVLTTQWGGSDTTQITALRAQKSYLIWWVFFPQTSTFIIWGIAGLVITNLLLVRRLLPHLAVAALNRWRTPDWTIWIVLGAAAGLLPYIVNTSPAAEIGAATVTVFNACLAVVLIALIPYTLQGLGVMSYYMKRWNFPRFLRGITYVIIFTQGLLPVAPSLGLLDFWTDWRGKTETRERQLQEKQKENENK